ncbi:metallophosphoesterase [Horticoccus sp. 23ND18S-11]|uniref:metallophosphoesterase n=1 Tax=Horticoccus sp. 23ND18S-11 TaxID=3391832 RepID=UPI0039C967E6
MSGPLTRIFSDIHFGDHASRVTRLAQLRPLLAGVDHAILNGDTLDTRPGPNPGHTAECRAAADTFFGREVSAATFLTGNHDADVSNRHHLDLADGEIFVTHGDIFFDDIVPWSKDARLIRRKIEAELRALPAGQHHDLDQRCAAFRRVAISIPQRHQSERNRLKYAWHYLADTVWPPLRILRVIRAWRDAPESAAAATQRHRPAARFVVSGHTHRPGIWRMPGGIIVVNTGSYCPPLGGCVVDVTTDRLIVRRVEARAGEFHPGDVVAAFPLAAR